MNILKVMTFMFVVSAVLQVAYGQHHIRCIPKEREALLQFKAAIVDHNGMLSSWTTPDCCQWEGIRCSNLTVHIISLDLHGEVHYYESLSLGSYYEVSRRYISGEIHKTLMELRQLQYLNLSFNDFRDTNVPEFLGSLTNLRYLDLSSCHFSGQIPTQISFLSHLKYLNLSRNYYLNGSIPRELGNLSRLQYLDLSSNYFEGSVPSQIGNLSRLEYLDLSGNSFEGYIPSQLGNLSNLHTLYLGGRYYSALKIGATDQWLSNLNSLTHLYLDSISNFNSSPSCLRTIAKLPKLRELSLIHCGLSDHFLLSFNPSNFNFSTSLSVLDLSSNSFTQPMLFQWVSNTTSNLVELDLSWNLLEGSTSNHFGLAMNSLEHLDLSYNVFKGEDLKSFINICTLRSLYMYENNMTEDLSSILHNLSSGCVIYSLQKLSLAFNQIRGIVPDLSVFSSLKILDLSDNQLSGKIPEGTRLPSHLEQLSIISNSLEGGVPKSFGSTCTLELLDLSYNKLSEDLTIIFNHLSGCSKYSLQELSLKNNQIRGSIPDLSAFSNLKTLDLSHNNLSAKIPEGTRLPSHLEQLSIRLNSLEGGVPKSFGSTCTLELLDLSDNKLSEDLTVIFNHLSGCSRYSLQELSLSSNQIRGSIPDLSAFSNLKRLDLFGNQLSGKIPEGTRLPSHLEQLSVMFNSLEGGVPKSFGSTCTLELLDLSDNKLSEELTVIFNHLSGCSRYSLQQLDLSMNQISGTLPSNLATMFPSLKELYLDTNKLNGTISEDLRFPAELEVLYLTSNSLKGVLTDSHFYNMTKLKTLALSNNSLALEISQNWTSTFQLKFIELRSCKLGPLFPKWLEKQNEFHILDISNSGISDKVPKWFWTKFGLSNWMTIDISCNNLQGTIPNLPIQNHYSSLNLASNQFEGHVPQFFRDSIDLDLSNNKFTNSSWFLCSSGVVETLYRLDLSNNMFSGQIPDCWTHFKSLAYLNMSQNKFSGEIPSSMGSLLELQVLLLRSNKLTGEIPSILMNCTQLVMVDIAENRLSGSIPNWIGNELSQLQFLSLRSNYFRGSLPLQICYLKSIQLLDLSQNNLSGEIPTCIKNFSSMAQMTSSRDYQRHYYLNAILMWKGSEQMFTDMGLSLLKSIDLSSNELLGEIPKEIECLFGLVSLNLSRNRLKGGIPSNVGKLTSLEFLDLSQNQLVGSIPSSLAQIDRLTVLDLSHNYLSGKIPTGTQLQSFDASKYEDNLDLCGPPLKKLCIDGRMTI
ncbi:LRR receptor-like serine/threonine-protein kinase GSO2 [Vigna radiata var. radiata]|uniref:LRR receptor-like serine/threonine-protein kinase GSO2 n=1 Tax=Vigna radiata var. radiata TaxID=3916 RepID=A0A3Q0ELY9_VIGRR|nr:LRR receptor-like serine/threonine-protein kinase GSO2 [Vigna radiata var. radiata]